MKLMRIILLKIHLFGRRKMKLDKNMTFDPESNEYKTIYKMNKKLPYESVGNFTQEVLEEVFQFAYGMSFGNEGHHRNHRTGGISRRKNGQIFADTFQGKLAEFALYNSLTKSGLRVEKPDNDMLGVGIWDDSDFDYKNKKISVKSTKSIGQLMLLEAADWNEDGLYIPNLGTGNEFYDYFVLVRLKPFATEFMKQNRLFFSEKIEKKKLRRLILQTNFTYDIPGCMTRKTLIWLIQNNYFVSQGGYINRFS